MDSSPTLESSRAFGRLGRQDRRALWTAGLLLSFAALVPPLGAGGLAAVVIPNAEALSDAAWTLVVPTVLLVTLCCGLALLPTFAATVLLVWMYGLVVGSILATLSYCAAAGIGWGVSRLVGRRFLWDAIDAHPKLRTVRDALLLDSLRRGTMTVLMLRISPMVPFAVVNVVAGATGARPDAFLLGTLFGLLPRILIVAVWTKSLETLSFTKTQDLPVLIGGAVLTLGILAFLGWWGRRILKSSAPPEPELGSTPGR